MSPPPSLRLPARPETIIRLGTLLLGVVVLGGCQPSAAPLKSNRLVGLSTSLPLLWGEAGDIRGQLAESGASHWTQRVMARHGRPVPLDTLADAHGRLPLPLNAWLVLVQPRPFTPDENVALDAWVRGGGRVLLFADPMLTAHSDFALGDPRRPQDIAMLSPILRHWGLELEFDPAQSREEHCIAIRGASLPVALSGRFRLRENPKGDCTLESGAILAICRVGRGRAVAVADAALFDSDNAGDDHAAVFDMLLAKLADTN